ncbi:hypothetical protein BS47DRAFT_1034972 [Hydnum rufescens UP504]|uniref:Uncharacterized protein n=1 Tax=Hydnum rufescens UP504 TaxID=1448309 RepID=A0A9P6AVX2_9AGAM|nr:hypothetical protein BS47DRAFT_1034972 [Hydnum rufescens UP504]
MPHAPWRILRLTRIRTVICTMMIVISLEMWVSMKSKPFWEVARGYNPPRDISVILLASGALDKHWWMMDGPGYTYDSTSPNSRVLKKGTRLWTRSCIVWYIIDGDNRNAIGKRVLSLWGLTWFLSEPTTSRLNRLD